MRPGCQAGRSSLSAVYRHVNRSLIRRVTDSKPPETRQPAAGLLRKWTGQAQRVSISSSLACQRPCVLRKLYGQDQKARFYATIEKEKAIKKAEELPSSANERRSDASKRFSKYMDRIESSIFIAGQRLNDLTGYTGIDALRREIEDQEKIVQSFRKLLQEARALYSQAISTRASSQREVNQLLQRKNAWSPEDLERFTALYRSDHANEQAETSARENLSKVEDESEEAAAKLTSSILSRYHEEQIWSDKIRRVSTWGTLALMGVNVLLFLVFQVGVEPWRRKRLVRGFEQKVQDALREAAETQSLQRLEAAGAATATKGSPATTENKTPLSNVEEESVLTDQAVSTSVILTSDANVVIDESETKSVLGGLRSSVKDMFSDKEIVVRRLDLTTAMFEGAAAGVVVVGFLVLLLRPR